MPAVRETTAPIRRGFQLQLNNSDEQQTRRSGASLLQDVDIWTSEQDRLIFQMGKTAFLGSYCIESSWGSPHSSCFQIETQTVVRQFQDEVVPWSIVARHRTHAMS